MYVNGTSRQGLSKPNLSSREIDEMIDDWTPEPLVPPLSEEEAAEAEAMPVCIHIYVCSLCMYVCCVCVCRLRVFTVQKYDCTEATPLNVRSMCVDCAYGIVIGLRLNYAAKYAHRGRHG